MQIANTVGSLKLPLFIKDGNNGRRKYTENPLYPVLMFNANENMTSYNLRRTMQYHALSYGNGYAFKQFDNAYRIRGLVLANPTRMRPEINKDSGKLEYVFKNPKTNKEEAFPKEAVFHIPGLGFDGIRGYGIIELAFNNLGLSIAYEEFVSRFLGQGTHIGGVVSLGENKKLSADRYDQFKEDLKKKYEGLGKSHGTIILEDGATYTPLGMPLVDAQLLQSRVFAIQDMARWLNMPVHKLKEMGETSYNKALS